MTFCRLTGKSKTKYKLHNLLLVCLKCRNSNCSKLHTFGCTYLSFHTIYRVETLRTHLYSPSLLALKILGKSEIRPKIWLEG